MDDRRCPFCGGMLLEKVCVNCGYEYLTEDEITAPYDFNPENDHFGEEEKSVQFEGMAGISAADVEMASIGISQMPRSAYSPKTAAYNNNPYPSNNAAPNISTARNNNPVPPPPQPAPPPQMPVQPQMSFIETFVKDVSTYIQKNWWKMLMVLLVPTSGYIIGGIYIFTGRYSSGIVDIATGIVYIIVSTLLKLAGVDILGIDVVLGNLLFEILRHSGRRRYRHY